MREQSRSLPCGLTDRISAARALRGSRRAAIQTNIRRGGCRSKRALVSCKCWLGSVAELHRVERIEKPTIRAYQVGLKSRGELDETKFPRLGMIADAVAWAS